MIKKLTYNGVTKFLMVSTQLCALVWVSISYLLAGYATIKLADPYPIIELSKQVVITVLGTMALKMLENVIEHNNGMLMGTSISTEKNSSEPTSI